MSTPVTGAVGRELGPALFGCSVAWLAVEVCRSHNVWPDDGASYAPDRRLRRWEVLQSGFMVCGASGLLFGPLGTLLTWVDLDIAPVLQSSQTTALGISGPAELARSIVHSAAIEDVVVVAATITLMKAVHRPTWEIYTLVCLIEVGLHAYFGLPAIAAVIMAAGRVWLYLRYRSLLPLMAAHALWNLFPVLGWLSLPYRLAVIAVLIFSAVQITRRLKKAANQPTSQAPASSQSVSPAHDSDRMQETHP
ncbi:type II CAAX prenyl endopeptidase Rce1 family protein [Streptomyces sp. NPDC006285]|uniref:CPBP family glutamic-type intramembrane protease n=1 Tax=Streptomyces sp. NPDC006285 TaxID=3364742 RepID=UPI0036915AB8